jgi:hypothetical protein
VKSRLLLVVVGVILSTLCVVATIAMGQGKNESQVTPLPFTGKILSVSARSGSEMGGIIENPEIKQVGGSLFLVGKGVDDGHPDNWYKGHTTWIALDDVSLIVEFKDLDSYKNKGK